jgi:uncharacterized repeat protein (TIGR03803 family)
LVHGGCTDLATASLGSAVQNGAISFVRGEIQMTFGRHRSVAPFSWTIVALAITTAGVNPAAAQTESVLYSFQGGEDGAQPVAGLIDKAGNLFGTTGFGGAAGAGTVLQLTPAASPGGSWTETVLYSFQGGTDGSFPFSVLVSDPAGNLYGTTLAGGSVCAICGTVFKLSKRGGTWTETVLHSFGFTDGANPFGKLLLDDDGNLYGTTNSGGDYSAGTVYELSPPNRPRGAWTEKVLYSFTGGSDGAQPLSDVIRDAAGRLYGTTSAGGLGFGVVFELRPGHKGWTESAIYSFTGANDGAVPYDGVAFDGRGSLIGVASIGGDPSCAGGGCGTVYRLTPPARPGGSWAENTLYAFTGGLDGAQPLAKPIVDGKGKLFGTASMDGVAYPCYPSCGTVYELAPPVYSGTWTETTLYDFAGGSDGSAPQASLVLGKGGVLYGTTLSGGNFGEGTIFAVVP